MADHPIEGLRMSGTLFRSSQYGEYVPPNKRKPADRLIEYFPVAGLMCVSYNSCWALCFTR